MNREKLLSVLRGSFVGFGALLSVIFLWRETVLLTIILSFLSIVMLVMWNAKENVKLFIICGLLGATVEALAVNSGAWHYTIPDAFGVPYWLPLLWGIAGVFIRKLAIRIGG